MNASHVLVAVGIVIGVLGFAVGIVIGYEMVRP